MEIWDSEQISKESESIVLSANLSEKDIQIISGNNSKIGEEVKKSSQLQKIASEIYTKLKFGKRFCIVEGLQFERLENDQTALQDYIIAFSSLLGTPTKTDKKNGHVMWPIKVDSEAIGNNLTYSQHRDAADLHTDTQYYPEPEEVISLWCLNPDKNNEGESLLVDGRKVIQAVRESTSSTIINLLQEEVYPLKGHLQLQGMNLKIPTY